MPTVSPLEKLESALSDTTGVYVNEGVDKQAYVAELTESIRGHICEPFEVRAEVVAPGFPDASEGSVIEGLCVAHHAGYWLVYQPDQDRFYCFWGQDADHLSAHGVFGSPLYCWSA